MTTSPEGALGSGLRSRHDDFMREGVWPLPQRHREILAPCPPTNGMAEGVRLTGGRMAVLSAGLRMAGKVSLRTGCEDRAAAPSIIPPLIGEAQRAGGVIRSR